MEATLPISNAKPEPAYRAPERRAAISDALAPSVTLPMRFVVTGLLSLFLAVGILLTHPHLLANYHYGPQIIALTHLLVLGWMGSLVMGSMYQLVPVALEARLHSERLGIYQHLLHVIGTAGMVWSFWYWDTRYIAHFGSLVLLGVIVFVYNVGRTLTQIPQWNVIAAGVASALFWLLCTVLAGMFAALTKIWPQINPFPPMALMHGHAHLGGVGFFMMMIVGVSYKLVPMFTLGEIQNQKRAWASVILLNIGVAGLFPAVLLARPWKFALVLIIVAGFLVYGWEIRAILRARKRKGLDWGLKSFFTALAFIAPLCVMGIILNWPGLTMTPRLGQLENVYGVLAIFAVFTFGIVGMLYKIIPFLVWYDRYSKMIGRYKVPSLGDMYSPLWQEVGYWTFLSAMLVLNGGIFWAQSKVIQAGTGLLAASLLAFAINVATMISHLINPRLEPLIIPAPKATKP
jgi:hypothetical protein